MIDRQQLVHKGFVEGNHRLQTPQETITRVWPLAPAMGITRIANVTGLDQIGIPVTMVTRPNSRSIAVSQGKGLTLAAAKASGLMEAVEGYHAEYITLPLKHGSYHTLKPTHKLVNIGRLPLLPGRQVDEHTPFFWIEGYDLLQETPKWVPFEMVHTNYTTPLITGEAHFSMTTNGLASGNHLLEAIIHAINELVERDATTLWGLLPLDQRMQSLLDPATITSEPAHHILAQYEAAAVDVYIWHQPSDVGLPTFRCEIHQREPNPLQRRIPYVGFGTHLTAEVALLRALTEAAQSRLVYIAGVRDDLELHLYEVSDLQEAENATRATYAQATPRVDYAALPSHHHPTFNQDLQFQLQALQAAGFEEVVVVDLTRPEFNIPVVRVIIPGLETATFHNTPYAPGERARRILEQL